MFDHRRCMSRSLVLAVAAIVLAGPAAIIAPHFAFAACCSNCYGTAYWYGNVTGADARIRVNNTMSATSSNTNYHVGNTLWVTDTDTGSQTCWTGTLHVNIGWVEIGYEARNNSYIFYSADCAPNGSFARWPLAAVQSTDYNAANYFEIFDAGTNHWYTSVTADSGLYDQNLYSNNMLPNMIEIGIEAAGDSLHADVAYVTNNRYIHGPNRYYQFGHNSSNKNVMGSQRLGLRMRHVGSPFRLPETMVEIGDSACAC